MRCWMLAALLLCWAEGSAAETLRFADLDGQPVELARPGGRGALVVHFWATWCPSCIDEMAEIERAAQSCTGATVEVIAVNVGEDAKTVQRFWRDHGLGLRSLRDPKGAVWRKLSGKGLPLNLVWTKSIRRTELGPSDAAGWQAKLRQLGCISGA